MNRVLLAYSGGIYSSLILHWLRHKRGYHVIAFAVKLGGEEFPEDFELRALRLGAAEVVVVDLVEDFVNDYVVPTLKAGAKYEEKYMFSAALSRPLIVKQMLMEYEEKDCDFLVHGSSPRGNDAVRFRSAVMALAPEVKILNPWAKWNLNDTCEVQRYIDRYQLDLDLEEERNRVDHNIWGRSIKFSRLQEDTWEEPVEELFRLTRNPQEAPDEPLYVDITFQRGLPTQLNEQHLDMVSLIECLNKIGGENAIGRIDTVESMLCGQKRREIYEAPAATILYTAHQALEELTLEKDFLHFKALASRYYAQLIYRGEWFSELKQALDVFFNASQAYVTGEVRLKLYKGNCTVVGCRSQHTLLKKRYPSELEGGY